MSNKIVPSIYRAVIDDVISAIKPEFEEYGVAEDVLAELQHKWENKVIASHVAEFEAPHQPIHHPHHPPLPPHGYPPHPLQHMQVPHHPGYPPPHNPYALPQPGQPQVKAEPMDNRFVLNGSAGPPPPPAYALPPLPGPQLNGARPHPGGQQSVLSFPTGPRPPQQMQRSYPPQPPGPTVAQQQQQQQLQQQPQQRIPQVDGPSTSDDDESDDSASPPAGAYAPHPSHPSLPRPSALGSQSTASGSGTQVEDSEAINSDLDDSDTEGEEDAEEGMAGETDIVFCTYDKVARVKNKWKCILKDGMIHINGRDYLFAKCTGEFEW